MESRTKFTLASSIIVILLVGISIFLLKAKESYTEKTKEYKTELKAECSDGEKKECVSAEGYKGYMKCENKAYSQKCLIASLDQCAITQNQLFSMCCKAKDGSLYDCNEKTTFKPGEYLIVKINLQMALQRAGINLSTYKACGFSNLAETESEVPKHYEGTTAFSSSEVGCSSELSAQRFHHGAIGGLVPNADGKTKLVEWRVYPSTIRLAGAKDAQDNLALSTSVFLYEVNVSG